MYASSASSGGDCVRKPCNVSPRCNGVCAFPGSTKRNYTSSTISITIIFCSNAWIVFQSVSKLTNYSSSSNMYSRSMKIHEVSNCFIQLCLIAAWNLLLLNDNFCQSRFDCAEYTLVVIWSVVWNTCVETRLPTNNSYNSSFIIRYLTVCYDAIYCAVCRPLLCVHCIIVYIPATHLEEHDGGLPMMVFHRQQCTMHTICDHIEYD